MSVHHGVQEGELESELFPEHIYLFVKQQIPLPSIGLCDPCSGLSCRSMNLSCCCMSRLFSAVHCSKAYAARSSVGSSSFLF